MGRQDCIESARSIICLLRYSSCKLQELVDLEVLMLCDTLAGFSSWGDEDDTFQVPQLLLEVMRMWVESRRQGDSMKASFQLHFGHLLLGCCCWCCCWWWWWCMFLAADVIARRWAALCRCSIGVGDETRWCAGFWVRETLVGESLLDTLTYERKRHTMRGIQWNNQSIQWVVAAMVLTPAAETVLQLWWWW